MQDANSEELNLRFSELQGTTCTILCASSVLILLLTQLRIN